MPQKKATMASTQKYLNVLAIKDGMVILRDGGIRTVLEVGSLNFALKSEEEQNGMLFQYQQFLNSLKFPLQIVMQSRRLDLYSYLKKLNDLLSKQTNDLIRMQTEEYITYIERLLTKANIMDKKFYVVIPYFPLGAQKNTMIDKVLGSPNKTTDIHFSKEKFIEAKQKLDERVNVISGGLGGMGLRVNPLNTQQIIELLYAIYNPAEAMSERMTEVQNLESPIVKTDLPTMAANPTPDPQAPVQGSDPAIVNPAIPTTVPSYTTGDQQIGGVNPIAGSVAEIPIAAIPTVDPVPDVLNAAMPAMSQEVYATPAAIVTEQPISPDTTPVMGQPDNTMAEQPIVQEIISDASQPNTSDISGQIVQNTDQTDPNAGQNNTTSQGV